MPNQFELAKQPVTPRSLLGPADVHEPPFLPAHPYPDWMSPGGGDARALLPWLDGDIGAPHEKHAASEDEADSNPVGTVLSVMDGAHVAADAAIEGGTAARTWGGLAAEMAHHTSEVMAGEASTAETVLAGVTGIAAPLAIGGGIMDVIEGVDQLKHGNRLEGGYSMASGGAGIISGVSGIAGLAGVGSAAAVAPIAGAAATGIKVGRYGDRKAQELDWFHDDQGEPITASTWAGQLGRSADDYFTDRGHPSLGSVAGVATTAGATLANVGITPAAAAIGAGHSIGDAAGHHHRTNHYASYDGVSHIAGGAASLADYDDQQAAAIERSKHQHPERWETNRNPTYGAWLAQLAKSMPNGGKQP